MFVAPFGAITRTYRHFQRYREVATVLLRHQFVDLVNALGLQRYLPISHRHTLAQGEAPAPSKYERLRMAFEELGPTVVKLGQFLSTRPDIVPPPLIRELEKLQDTVPPVSSEEVRQVLVHEFGQPVDELFAEFEDRAHASASIGQVHRAVTMEGIAVAVKVQRPRIATVIETDLEIMADLAGLIERMVAGAALFEPTRLVQEFSRVIRRELDFASEASNMERFARHFARDKHVHVPCVYRELTTERVLTMEYVRGVKVSDAAKLKAQGLDPEVVAGHGARLLLEQVFTHGFFHADPHPGNILILPGNRLCFLDYGMMGVLSTRHRENLGALIQGLVARDERRVASAVFRLSGYNRFENSPDIEADIANFIQDRLYRPLREIDIGQAINELTHMLVSYGIRMPSDLFLLTKAVTTIEGIGRQLSPEFDVMSHIQPFVRKQARTRANVRRLTNDFYLFLLDIQSLLKELPSETRELITLLKRGEIRLKFEHRGLEGLIRSNDQISNRVVFAIVLASLIIGSSLMTLSKISPKWGEVPIIGFVGFVVSGVMGFCLLWSILKHGRM